MLNLQEEPREERLAGADPARASDVSEIRHIKLPPFWQVNPTLWFAQVDAQFYAMRIRSDDTKYFTVVASLDSSVLQQVSDIIAEPPEVNKYVTLKKELIGRFTESQDRQIRRLLTDMELGDRKPSQLLREMRNLATKKVEDNVLRTLWLQRLPVRAQIVLSVSPDTALDKLAQMADKIIEVSHHGSIMAAEAGSSSSATLEVLQKQVDALTLEVKKLTGQKRYNRSRSSSGSRGRNQSSERSTYCWYHQRFGTRAHKCKVPCNFSPDRKTSSEN